MQLEFDIQRNLHRFQDLSEPHWHDTLEILVCLSDGGRFAAGDSVFPLCRGTVHIVKKGTLHRCLVEVSSYERYIIHIAYETLWMLSSQQTDLISIFDHASQYVTLDDTELSQLSELIEQCLCQQTEIGADFERNILLMRVILFLIRHMHSDGAEVKDYSSKEFLKVMPIINFIHDNYSKDISLEQLSHEFFISKYYLCRLFKESTGFSLGGYIINYRVRQACFLLRKGASVQEAGENVGFGNNANFIRTFKRIIGMTPGKYAQHYQKRGEED